MRRHMTLPRTASIVIVGGGVVGCSIAYHLAGRGVRVDARVAAGGGPGDGLAGPAEVTNGFARRARERGVKLAEGVRVTAIERADDRVTGVTTTDGAVSAPLVINAAGPVAATVGRLAGVEIAVYPRRRHIFYTEPFPEIPRPIPPTTDPPSRFH